MIIAQFTHEAVRLGECLSGVVSWTKLDMKAPRGIHLLVGWRTTGQGKVIRQPENEVRLSLEESLFAEPVHYPSGMGSASSEEPVHYPFDISIPTLGPVSYNGFLLSIIWELTVRIDNAFGRDEVAYFPFTVLPRLVAGPTSAAS